MVAFSTFRSLKSDALLTLLQIGAVQCFGYLFMGILFYSISYFDSSKFPISFMFEYHIMSVGLVDYWKIFIAFLLSAVCNSFLLQYIVERGRKCMDFSITFYFFHFIFTCIYSEGFPTRLIWWLAMLLSLFIMASLGRYLCLRRELLPISVQKPSASPAVPDPNNENIINRGSFELDDSEYEMDNLINQTPGHNNNNVEFNSSDLQPSHNEDSTDTVLEVQKENNSRYKTEKNVNSNALKKTEGKKNTTEIIRSNLLMDMNENLLSDKIDTSLGKSGYKNLKSSNNTSILTKKSIIADNSKAVKTDNLESKRSKLSFDNSDWGDDDSWGIDDDFTKEEFTSKKKD
ncbi:Protein SYS1-like protein [Smittium mucronatum]|uniref:Protein SYS1-like protein n=1 Tax=Smittium mucronatum TaxID=133383 RepID=A0A1R0GM60_9FUNG|nr:Protein SYS1-like protein [Smittium mucronatum]